MKHTLLLFMYLFVTVSFTQTIFSVAPLIYTKWSACNYPGGERFTGDGIGLSLHYMSEIQQNSHYRYYIKRLGRTAGLDIGLRIQASFKGGKHLLLLDWASDVATTSSGISFLQKVSWSSMVYPYLDSTPAYPTYYTSSSDFQSGYTYTRYSLQYGTRIVNDSSFLKLWILFDVSMARTGAMRGETTYSYNDHPIELASNAKILQIKNEDWQFDRRVFKFGLGLKGDFFIKTKKKTSYLFSLEAHYRHGLKTIGSSSYSTLLDDSGSLVAYTNNAYTKGSGLYLQISRSFQLYPWKTKNKINDNNSY